MNNLEILKEIDKKADICKGKIYVKSTEEINAIISDIEKLIKQYKPENAIQKNIIKNRILEIDNLKYYSQNSEKEKRKSRTYFMAK